MTAIKAAETIVFEGVVGEYRDAIWAWTRELLDPYLAWLRGPGAGRGTPKQFNDPVWGTIVLQPHEIAVLDSPLVQRLRRIRQLGVVHLVYPGANHTRFEHSLGVCHQVSELAHSLNRIDQGQGQVIDQDAIDTLRLAGLLHDVGHGLMSHVVENALNGEYTSESVRIEFGRQVKRSSKPQLSEMAAYFMISSPAVKELIDLAYLASTKQAPSNVASTIARIVIGQRVSDDSPVLQELITGPFDADKLDYMPRDARMCGVPVVTDVVRLIQKVRAVTVSTDNLPERMTKGGGLQALPGGHQVFGVARSGASALDEVSLNRSLMFDKVYRHQKVRAVEAMVGSAIQLLHPLWGSSSATMPLMVMDDQFIELTHDDLVLLNEARSRVVRMDHLRVAHDILSRLRGRILFHRAFAFAATMPGDAYRDDVSHEPAAERFIRELDKEPEKREDFVSAVIKVLVQIATLDDHRKEIDEIGVENLQYYIRVDPPSSQGHGSQSDQSRAFLVDESDNLIPVEKDRSETRAWADAYVNTKDVGFIFAPAELSDMVHIAAEVAARTEYNVIIPPQMHNYAKKGTPEIAALRRRLREKGFYDDLPRDLTPSELFDDAEAKRLVSQTLKHLQGYMGPTQRRNSPAASGSSLNETKVLRWAAQFPAEHQIHALRIAQRIRMLTRDDANNTIRRFSELHPAFDNARFVPLGEAKDGSSILAYYLRDSQRDTGYKLSNVLLALREDEPVVFVDDFVGMGRSAVGILRTLMGESGGDDLGEERQLSLTEDEKVRLAGRPIALVWVAGYSNGAQHVVEELASLGITQVTTYVHEKAEDLPTVRKALSDLDPEVCDDFIAVCSEIGRQLLAPVTAPNKLGERVLGYGNRGLLLTNSYNTPSVTLTALAWEGMVDDREWTPLIPRMKKE